MYTAKWIRAFVFHLPDDRIFTTRELVHMGSRNAVDLTLYRMVRAGEIMRIARGVFVKHVENLDDLNIFKIAKAKAKAFGKKIFRYGSNAALQTDIIKEYKNGNEDEFLFYTSGCSSSFVFSDYTIKFVSASSRKRELNETDAGELLKAVWFLGKHNAKAIRPKARRRAKLLCPEDRRHYRKKLRHLPIWMMSVFFG